MPKLSDYLRAEAKLSAIVGCFEAAEVEGLYEALRDTIDLRLKDLVERRLMYAYYTAKGEYVPWEGA